MNIPPEIDLDLYHINTVEKIAAFLGSAVDAVAAYPRFSTKIPHRAVTIELDGITPENPEDIGTEQLQAQVRFAAYVFVSYLETDPELAVRKLATRLVAFVYGNRFGCRIGPAKIITAQPDDMELPGKSGRAGEAEDYHVWRVEWSHEALIGQSVWDDEGTTPVEVWTVNNGEATNILTP